MNVSIVDNRQRRSERRRRSLIRCLVIPSVLIGTSMTGCSDPESVETPRGIGGLAPIESFPKAGGVFFRPENRLRPVTELQAATELAPEDPRGWSDLAAALVARGDEEQRPEYFVEALDAVLRAHELDSTAAEISFNRALALEKVHLEGPSLEAWQLAERRAPSGSPLRDEFASHVARLSPTEPDAQPVDTRLPTAVEAGRDAVDALVRSDRSALEDWFDEHVIRRWIDGEAVRENPERAMAQAIAAGFERVAEDRSLVDILTTLGNWDNGPDGSASRNALSLFVRARELHGRDESELAASAFTEMLDVCPAPCQPFAGEAMLRLAIYDYYRADTAAATFALEQLVELTERRGYPSLDADAHWMLGLIQSRAPDLPLALQHFARARELLIRAREPGRAVELDIRIASLHGVAGDARSRWRVCYRVLEAIDEVPSTRGRVHAFFAAGQAVLQMGYPRAALPFHDLALVEALAGGVPAELAQAAITRSQVRIRLGDANGALDDLRLARQKLAGVPDGSYLPHLLSELSAAEGRVLSSVDPAAALTHLDPALAYFAEAEADHRLAQVYLDRGRTLEALGQAAGAVADLTAGIESYERHRKGLASPRSITYFDRSRDLFDELVLLQAEGLDDPSVSWLVAERSRARDLLDQFQPDRAGSAELLSSERVRSILPEGHALVTFTQLDDRLIVWVLRADGIEHSVTQVARAAINSLVAEMLTGLDPAYRNAQPEKPARELYRLLIEPIEHLVANASSLIFVPDGALHRLPFGALIDPQDGTFLIERYTVSVAPSANVLFHAERRARPRTSAPSLLAVGDPAFDPTAYPRLVRLPGSRREAEAVANLYAKSTLLIDDEATPGRFIALAGRHSVLHVAGHALTDLEFPERSRLVLAKDFGNGNDGGLPAGELYELALTETRLVVLAACSTASGKVSRGEGALSLVRPFLAGGVPAVVASLWTIDDATSVVFFEKFHRGWLEGHSVADALRAVQLEFLGSTHERLSTPSSWAAMQVFGSPSLAVIRGDAKPAR